MRKYTFFLAAIVFALAACGGSGGSSTSSGSNGGGSTGVYADRVVAYNPVIDPAATEEFWPYFYDETLALGAPGGTLDTVSLGYDPVPADTLGGTLVLGFGDDAGHRCIVDDVGDDLVVFENPFSVLNHGAPIGVYSELAVVEVSADNATWYDFPHAIDSAFPLVDPARYSGFAGVVLRSKGGDRFDLADVIAAHSLPADFQACYIRLTDGGTLYPDYGNTQSDLYASGADIDAVQALHSVAMPGP